MRPFAEVEHPEWREMLSVIQQLYKPVNEKTYTRIAEKMYKDFKVQVCERVFSTAGNVITEKRNRLDPHRASHLIFLHENRHWIKLQK